MVSSDKVPPAKIGNVPAELELVRTGRGVVQNVATELPERRNPELANVDVILHRGAESASSVSSTPHVIPCQPIGEKAYEVAPQEQQMLFESTARAMGDARLHLKQRHVDNRTRADPAYRAVGHDDGDLTPNRYPEN